MNGIERRVRNMINPYSQPRPEPAWTPSCPGHPKHAPAIPPAIPAGVQVPARNPSDPQPAPLA